MIEMTLSDITKVIDGRLQGNDKTIIAVSIDSRTLNQGDIFLALKGKNFDGHQYLQQAKDKGCTAAIVEHECAVDISQIIVKNSHQALGKLAAYVKSTLDPKTVAITGSSGKTTVKEMVASILSQRGNVLATQGNYNNDIGVPLTLLRLTAEHKYAVVELGANHLGEIAYTTKLVQPDVALINNIAPAHLAGFGDLAGVARAKGEIYQGLPRGGVAIFEQGNRWATMWQEHLAEKEIRYFSMTSPADCYSDNVTFDNQGRATFTLHANHEKAQIKLPIPGEHNVKNALASATIALALGAQLQDVILGLENLTSVKGRLNICQLNSQITLIDDSYNANVDSVQAAIKLLATYQGKRILVLGDMAELGHQAKKYHQQIGEYAKQQNIDALFTVGKLTEYTAQAFIKENKKITEHFDEKEALVLQLKNFLSQLTEKVTILVKGSRSAGMEAIITNLVRWQQQQTLQELA